MTRRYISGLVCVLLLSGAAHGQRYWKLPVGKDTTLDILVRVPAPAARCLVVSEVHKLLAVGHHAKNAAAHVSLFRLDAAGKPQGEPATLVLPKPAGLDRLPNQPTGLAFHPTRPLLYVWQDVVRPRTPQNQFAPLEPAEVAALNEIDHLLIYRVEEGKPRLLVALCRGDAFGHGRPHGGVCVDDAGERLYVPNLRAYPQYPKHEGVGVGSYVLDAEGLPVVGKDEKGERSAGKGSAAKAIAKAVKAGKPVMPQRVTPVNSEISPDVPAASTGHGFIPLGRDRVMFGGGHDVALATWQPEDRAVRLDLVQPPNGYQRYYPARHPTAPLIYVAGLDTPRLFQFEHVDGHLTLAPLAIDVMGSNLHSPPVVMAKHNLLAVGGRQRILLIPLDDKGRIKPERTQVLIGNQNVQALAYSAKFDLLYAGVEKGK